MRAIQVFSRRGCHLCEVLIEELMPVVRDVCRVEVLDVDSRPEWREAYGKRVPVVEFDGDFVCQYYLDRDAIMARLARAAPEDDE